MNYEGVLAMSENGERSKFLSFIEHKAKEVKNSPDWVNANIAHWVNGLPIRQRTQILRMDTWRSIAPYLDHIELVIQNQNLTTLDS